MAKNKMEMKKLAAAFDAAMKAEQEADNWEEQCDESGAARLALLRSRAEALWKAHDIISFPDVEELCPCCGSSNECSKKNNDEYAEFRNAAPPGSRYYEGPSEVDCYY